MYIAREWQNRPPDGYSEEWVFEPSWEDRVQLTWDSNAGIWIAQSTLGVRCSLPLIKNGSLNTDFWAVENQSVSVSVVVNPDDDEELLVEALSDGNPYYLQLSAPFRVANSAIVRLGQRGNGWSGSTDSGNIRSGPFIGEVFFLPYNGGAAQSAVHLMNRRDGATESYSRHMAWDPSQTTTSTNHGNTSPSNKEVWEVGSCRPDHEGSDRELRVADSTGNSATITQTDPAVTKTLGATVATTGYSAANAVGWYWEGIDLWI